MKENFELFIRILYAILGSILVNWGLFDICMIIAELKNVDPVYTFGILLNTCVIADGLIVESARRKKKK